MRDLIHICIWLNTQIHLNDSFSFGVRLGIQPQPSLYIAQIGEVRARISFLYQQ